MTETAETTPTATRRRRRQAQDSVPILQVGFRPFFLMGSIWAACAVLIWLGVLSGRLDPPGAMDPLAWHRHEMLFGFTSAIITGFILTAIPNWTGRLPVAGAALAWLALLWLAGRTALLLGNIIGSATAAVIDGVFLVVLAGLVAREIIMGSNWRNLPPALIIGLLAVANAMFHLEDQEVLDLDGSSVRLGIGAIAMLIGLIGGRIVPSFTRNWLVKRQASSKGAAVLPRPFSRYDRVALLLLAVALAGWIIAPESRLVGFLLASAGVVHAIRLSRWCGWRCTAEPLVLILHIGYGWLAFGLWLLGMASLLSAFSQLAALHALTTGAFGTMMLAVMTRASLGHSGYELAADRWTVLIYAAMTSGAIARIASPLFQDQGWLQAAGLLWAGAFLLFALAYGRTLFGYRPTPAKS